VTSCALLFYRYLNSFSEKFWLGWSWGGVCLIFVGPRIQVRIDVRINERFRQFYNSIQKVLALPNSISYVLLAPSILAGLITLGVMQQIIWAFYRVLSSFQFLVKSWPTIVELISVYKRLRTFSNSLR
jgi:ABC-type long-subunit fatty acid transport system fused permease/ATPase subunit